MSNSNNTKNVAEDKTSSTCRASDAAASSHQERTGAKDGLSRTIAKLEKRIFDGEYYEAHQLYRSIYFRYVSQHKYTEAIDLLFNGAMNLLKASQISSGADLALLMVDTLDKNKVQVTEENIDKVTTLHRLISKDHIERQSFVVAAMRWSKQISPAFSGMGAGEIGDATAALPSTAPDTVAAISRTSAGDPRLHGQFAVTYWLERDYTMSRYHFIRSQDGERCASMLIEYHVTRGYPGEVDLFIAQTVFQYLCLRNKMMAEACFYCYTKQHPQVERGPPFIHPLLNFLWMLLLSLDGGNVTIFTILCEQYNPSLLRDPTYHDYIARIGQLFFHVPLPKSNHSQGLFGNLLSSFLTMEDSGESLDDDRLLSEYSPEELD